MGWTWPPVQTSELTDGAALVERFRVVCQAGLVTKSQADLLAFVSFACYCVRAADVPGAMFNAGLRDADRYGRTWRQKPSDADERRARSIIRQLDPLSHSQPPAAAQGLAESLSVSTGQRSTEAERRRQLEALEALS